MSAKGYAIVGATTFVLGATVVNPALSYVRSHFQDRREPAVEEMLSHLESSPAYRNQMRCILYRPSVYVKLLLSEMWEQHRITGYEQTEISGEFRVRKDGAEFIVYVPSEGDQENKGKRYHKGKTITIDSCQDVRTRIEETIYALKKPTEVASSTDLGALVATILKNEALTPSPIGPYPLIVKPASANPQDQLTKPLTNDRSYTSKNEKPRTQTPVVRRQTHPSKKPQRKDSHRNKPRKHR